MQASREHTEILLIGGELPKIVLACQDVLLAQPKPNVFRRGGMLVRIMRGDAASMREVQDKTPGRLNAVEVTQDWLRILLTDLAAFFTFNKKAGQWVGADCPPAIAKGLLEMSGSWKLPCLLTITNTPTLRADGTVLEVTGYDAATAVYFDPGNVAFPEVPEGPTRDAALAARDALMFVFKDFPFATAEDRSVALAAVLTALVRPALRAAPLFAFTAPKMASGKSLLADLVALIATGRVGRAMPQGKDEEEDRKRLLAILKDGDPIAVIDNVERPLGGGALCAALTQEVYCDRILGSTRMVSFPTCLTWLATGNNLVVEGDLTTRVLICRLDAGVERPEEREFDIEPRSYVSANRGALAVAGLTLLRAYEYAGRPRQNLRPFGRFEDFSDLVRSALVWLGEADPCDVRRRVEDADPARQLHIEFMAAWLEVIGSVPVSASELIAAAACGMQGVVATNRLHELLLEVASRHGSAPSARRLGMWLASKRDRIEGGMRIVQIGQKSRVAIWVVEVDDTSCAAPRCGESPIQTHLDSQTHQNAECGACVAPDSGESVSPSESVWHSPESDDAPPCSVEAVPGCPEASCGSGAFEVSTDVSQANEAPRTSGGAPNGRCIRCGSTTFWRLLDIGDNQPGEPRCNRCYPAHPAEHLIERIDDSGGAP